MKIFADHGCTRLARVALVVGATLGFGATCANAQDTVQIGLATKAWFPTVIAQTAADQGFFKDEGIDAELTVYQSGGETVTAMVAGAADVISSSSSVTASSRAKGVDSKLIGLLGAGNYGWQLLVTPDSPIKDVKDLEGKKVGITSAGSLSDMLARWTMSDKGVAFESIPLGGGGLVPNLISGNVDAAVVYSPLSYDLLMKGDARALIDYGTAIPEHLNSGWTALSSFIQDDPELTQKTVNALYRGVAYLQDNKDAAVKIIADLNDIPTEVAEKEWENVFLKLSRTGEMTEQEAETAMKINQLTGIENLPEASEIWVGDFTPVKVTEKK
ncbi:ABC transporter substrate-binding protein [Amorphus sp. MBR-141]